ncbi:MAG TPA: aminotransferase class V-fold PLP-dependent enzyme [bacterium]|nr:aminotransferase class V-fold PLP-dependent enzyme [bacterium]
MKTSDYSHLFLIEPGFTALNHGSFGSCPAEIINYQFELVKKMESLTTRFFTRIVKDLNAESMYSLSRFVNASSADMIFIRNATTAANAVINSMTFKPGDEIVTTNLIYGSCRNALDYAAQTKGAVIKKANIPFPVKSENEIAESILGLITKKTKLIFIDHVTSETALILPVQKICDEANRLGIDVFIDGAHAPGMLPLDISAINPTYYTGNCHKWICAPKGTAFLFVRPEKQESVIPPIISNYFCQGETSNARFHSSFDWSGTMDYTNYACVGKTIDYLENKVSGGWNGIMKRNHELVITGRNIITKELHLDQYLPDELIGSMATIKLNSTADIDPKTGIDLIQMELLDKYNIETVITTLYPTKQRILRISAALYNNETDYEKLAEALKKII